MALGKNITWKKGKQHHLPYDIKAVGKNIKCGRGEESVNFGEENKDFKNMGVRKNIML